MMEKAVVLEWFKKTRIVPVIRAANPDEAMEASEQLVEGGVDILEITMTVPGAIELIKEVSKRFSDRALVGAGTVYDPTTASACIESGARFIVSPCTDTDTIKFCSEAGVVIAAGAFTPTEVVRAWSLGSDVIKVFPCDAGGGASYIKSLKAPFPHIPLMPTGGVTLQNVRQYLDAGSIAVGVGSNLVNLEMIRQGRKLELADLARSFIEVSR